MRSLVVTNELNLWHLVIDEVQARAVAFENVKHPLFDKLETWKIIAMNVARILFHSDCNNQLTLWSLLSVLFL